MEKSAPVATAAPVDPVGGPAARAPFVEPAGEMKECGRGQGPICVPYPGREASVDAVLAFTPEPRHLP